MVGVFHPHRQVVVEVTCLPCHLSPLSDHVEPWQQFEQTTTHDDHPDWEHQLARGAVVKEDLLETLG